MSKFIIPKGIDYDFTIQVFEEDSFLPQDLTDFVQGAGSELILLDIVTGDRVSLGAHTGIYLEAIGDSISTPEVFEYRVAYNDYGVFTINVNNVDYSFNHSSAITTPLTTQAIASKIGAKMGVMPNGVVATVSSDKITITNSSEKNLNITVTSNIVNSKYTKSERSSAAHYSANGYLRGTVRGDQSANLTVLRGDKEDGYPLLPGYQAVIRVKFQASSPVRDRTSIISKVYVSNAGAH